MTSKSHKYSLLSMSLSKLENLTISEGIKRLAAFHGLKQRDVAELLGISKSAVSMKFAGKASFNSQELLILADCFNVTVDYLLGREPMEVR